MADRFLHHGRGIGPHLRGVEPLRKPKELVALQREGAVCPGIRSPHLLGPGGVAGGEEPAKLLPLARARLIVALASPADLLDKLAALLELA